MANQHDRPWSTQPHTQREMAQLKTRQERVHILISEFKKKLNWLKYTFITGLDLPSKWID